MNGPTQDVVSAYLSRYGRANAADPSTKSVTISKVSVRNEHGECARFRSGEKAWIDVELTARANCRNLSLSIYITDSEYRSVFDTSTERLGHGNFALEEGDVYTCTFELNLNMASGIFHPAVLVYSYNTQTEHDRWAPAATIYVSSEDDVRGTVHFFPKVIQQGIHSASVVSLPAMASETGGNKKCN